MNSEKMKRRLIAILSADVKGYSRLMSVDEGGAVRLLTAYKEVMGNLIRQYGGRVVDAPGDNLLAEFSSVGMRFSARLRSRKTQGTKCGGAGRAADGVSDRDQPWGCGGGRIGNLWGWSKYRGPVGSVGGAGMRMFFGDRA